MDAKSSKEWCEGFEIGFAEGWKRCKEMFQPSLDVLRKMKEVDELHKKDREGAN